jgi:hypothetical protein
MIVGEFPQNGDMALFMLRERAARMIMGGIGPDDTMAYCKIIYQVWISFSSDWGVHHHWQVEEAIRKGILFATEAWDDSEALFKEPIASDPLISDPRMIKGLTIMRTEDIREYVNLEVDFWLGKIPSAEFALAAPVSFDNERMFARIKIKRAARRANEAALAELAQENSA